MAFKLPFKAHNYLGEFATEAAALAWIQAMRWDSTKNGAGNPEPGMCFYDTTRTAMKAYTNGAWGVVTKDDPGSVACFQIIQAGVPIAGETLTIGADVMEADGAGANINFVIAAAEATMDNLLAAWIANGVELFFGDKIDATHLRFRSAATHQGAIVAADPACVLAEAMTNYIFDCGAVNVNTLGGRAAGVRTPCYAEIAINAGHVTSGQCRVSFPGAVLAVSATLWTAAGVPHAIPADAITIAHGDVLITVAGGGAPNLIAGDIVRITASY
jgi:hypothetical protein